jgi:hypothetical protein
MAECRHLVEQRDCADCRPAPAGSRRVPGLYGPWFIAAYDGDCSGCGQEFSEGDEIRADGQGGWLARCCGGDSALITRSLPPAPDPGASLLERFASGQLDYGHGC